MSDKFLREHIKELIQEELRYKHYPTAQEVIDDVTDELNKKHFR